MNDSLIETPSLSKLPSDMAHIANARMVVWDRKDIDLSSSGLHE